MERKIKELEVRVASLERLTRKIYDRLGMREEEIDAMEYQDVIAETHRTGNYKPLKEYLKRKNARDKKPVESGVQGNQEP